MTHVTLSHFFDTKEEAEGYIVKRKANKDPVTDLYISGPFETTDPMDQIIWYVKVETYR